MKEFPEDMMREIFADMTQGTKPLSQDEQNRMIMGVQKLSQAEVCLEELDDDDLELALCEVDLDMISQDASSVLRQETSSAEDLSSRFDKLDAKMDDILERFKLLETNRANQPKHNQPKHNQPKPNQPKHNQPKPKHTQPKHGNPVQGFALQNEDLSREDMDALYRFHPVHRNKKFENTKKRLDEAKLFQQKRYEEYKRGNGVNPNYRGKNFNPNYVPPPRFNNAPPAYNNAPPAYNNAPPAYNNAPPAYNNAPPAYNNRYAPPARADNAPPAYNPYAPPSRYNAPPARPNNYDAPPARPNNDPYEQPATSSYFERFVKPTVNKSDDINKTQYKTYNDK
jgi:hypothetical protein